jgi:hypothetical protein
MGLRAPADSLPHTGSSGDPLHPGSLGEALALALESGERLGLDVTEARAVATTIEERGGYPSDLYVLALAGGTGVGKSSLLNAIAGEVVSRAGARRPTTETPVAWVPADRREEAEQLLAWLGGAEARSRPSAGPPVAIVDLPDLDSIEPGHAARVDAVLPRVDAVLWVTDPEKYDDAVLHDGYLRRWMPRLARQAVAINKTDRLTPADVRRVRDDLSARLRSEGLPEVPLLLASAIEDVEPVRAWLHDGAAAKEIVRGRLRAAAAEAVRSLAATAGVEAEAEPSPLVPAAVRSGAAGAARAAVLGLVDLPGLRRQAMAATRADARPVGGGPLGLIRSLLERGSGARERRADPEGYLRRWRERGSLDRPVAAVRDGVASVLPNTAPPIRPALARVADPAHLGDRLAKAIDGAIAGPGAAFHAPRSRLWPLLGLGQLLGTAAVVAGVVWLLTLYLAGGSVTTPVVEMPLVGPFPTPAALLLAGLAAWFLLGRLLTWHAGWLGARWADRLDADITARVTEAVDETVTARLAGLDASRHALWSALRALGPEPDPAARGREPGPRDALG